MRDIGDFFADVLWNWWTILAGIMIAVEPVTRLLWHGYDEWAAKWLSPTRRKKMARVGALMALLIANYLAFHDAKEEARKAHATQVYGGGRHLRSDEQARMLPELQLTPKQAYLIEINSLPNCDECEVYAQEFRDLFNSVSGWKAIGSATVFMDPSAPRYGLQLLPNSDALHPGADKKIIAAFNAAGIPLKPMPAAPYAKQDAAIIVVARSPK